MFLFHFGVPFLLQIEAEFKEFSLSAATIADSVGISIAGAISIPAHNRICSLNLKMWMSPVLCENDDCMDILQHFVSAYDN